MALVRRELQDAAVEQSLLVPERPVELLIAVPDFRSTPTRAACYIRYYSVRFFVYFFLTLRYAHN